MRPGNRSRITFHNSNRGTAGLLSEILRSLRDFFGLGRKGLSPLMTFLKLDSLEAVDLVGPVHGYSTKVAMRGPHSTERK